LQGRLEEFFTRYGVVSAVRMRRDENKKFKVCHLAYRHQSITDPFFALRTLYLQNSVTLTLSMLFLKPILNQPGRIMNYLS